MADCTNLHSRRIHNLAKKFNRGSVIGFSFLWLNRITEPIGGISPDQEEAFVIRGTNVFDVLRDGDMFFNPTIVWI